MQYWCIASTMFAITDLTLCVNKLYVNLTVDRPFETVFIEMIRLYASFGSEKVLRKSKKINGS